MAAKFDGKRASENAWVAQQNLAKAKGGRPHYQPKLRPQKTKVETTIVVTIPLATTPRTS